MEINWIALTNFSLAAAGLHFTEAQRRRDIRKEKLLIIKRFQDNFYSYMDDPNSESSIKVLGNLKTLSDECDIWVKKTPSKREAFTNEMTNYQTEWVNWRCAWIDSENNGKKEDVETTKDNLESFYKYRQSLRKYLDVGVGYNPFYKWFSMKMNNFFRSLKKEYPT